MSMTATLVWGMNEGAVYLWTLPMFHSNGWCYTWSLADLCRTNICLWQVTAKAVCHSQVWCDPLLCCTCGPQHHSQYLTRGHYPSPAPWCKCDDNWCCSSPICYFCNVPEGLPCHSHIWSLRNLWSLNCLCVEA